MAKKVLNERCPLQAECERKTCEYVHKELECPYYSANAREGHYIYDQEEIRDRRDREAMDEALLAHLGDDDDDTSDGLVYIPVEQLYPHPDNPRKDLGDLTELADSIKANGILQNLTVVPHFVTGEITGDTWQRGYTVIIGHRRLAASKLAGLKELPCVITEMDHRSQVQTMLMENMQRSDLTVYEQAQGFQMMLDMGDSVEEIAKKSGFSRTTVRRRVKMMELDQKQLKEVSERQISLSDFDRLAQIEDIKTRNKVLKDIGTYNFDSSVTRAIREEHRKKVTPDAKKQIKALGLKEIPDRERYSGKYEAVKSINLDTWDPESGLGVRDATKILYSLDHWGNLYFYKKRERAAQKKKSRAEAERERVIANAHASLKEEEAVAFELRQKFVRSIPVSQKTLTPLLCGAVIGIVSSTVLYKSADRSNLLKLIGVDPDGKYDEVRSRAIKAITTMDLGTIIPDVVYASFQDSKENGYHSSYKGEWPKHEENLMLDALYAWLNGMGYEMSDSEKALQDGTHELFQNDMIDEEERCNK